MYVPIRELEVGETYDQIFLIRTVTDLKKVVKITLQDVTGTVDGIVVGGLKIKPVGSAISPGKFIRLKCKISLYKGSPSIVVDKKDIAKCEEPSDTSLYVHGPNQAMIDAYKIELKDILQSVTNDGIRDLLGGIFSKINIDSVPLEHSGPLYCRGALLTFVVDSIRIFQSMYISTSRIIDPDDLDYSIIVAGILLRNIGTIKCFAENGKLFLPSLEYAMGENPYLRNSIKLLQRFLIELKTEIGTEIQEELELEDCLLESPQTVCGKTVVNVCRLARDLYERRLV